jgi:two-component system, NtrC family, response regulator HydG
MTGLKVLVVDDDADFADSLAEALELNGHKADTAYSGGEGIQRFESSDYDITFMDVKMPGLNGVESFLAIRRLKPDARVVMMTGFSVEQLLEEAVRNGAWGVLRKPLDMGKIRTMLEEIKPAGVLIVDDDRDFVANLREVLEGNGYNVFQAHDGQEALRRVRSGGIDVLILDLRLPLLSGLEIFLVLQRLGYSLPTIIVTAYAREEAEAVQRLSSFELSGVLTKPFDTKMLLKAIEAIVAQQRSENPPLRP